MWSHVPYIHCIHLTIAVKLAQHKDSTSLRGCHFTYYSFLISMPTKNWFISVFIIVYLNRLALSSFILKYFSFTLQKMTILFFRNSTVQNQLKFHGLSLMCTPHEISHSVRLLKYALSTSFQRYLKYQIPITFSETLEIRTVHLVSELK